jgi:hypothetical protein
VPEALCEPFASCEGLDGRLLISAAIQGPPLAWDLGYVDSVALQQPLARLLSGTQDTRVAGKGASPPAAAAAGLAGSPVGALRWSESIVREDSVLVPLAEAETAASAFGLKGQARTSFLDTLGRISPEIVAKLFPVEVQNVHLFMGTHIEAVAGECVLKDLPPLPEPAPA